MSIVAINVRRIIMERCFKQSAIAQKAGYSIKKFNNMLQGRKIITSEDILPISEALGVLPNDLFVNLDDQKGA
ncbi:MAG TPA: XRE family transcriptional regulator [Ruminiclostridium sp.]